MIEEIRAASSRLQGHIMRTPMRYSAALSRASGAEVFLKLETLQPTFSFKIRGATNAVLKLAETGDPRPIVTASAGNHGYAMAHAAARAGRALTVYIAENAPRTKVDAIRGAGADVRPCRNYDEAELNARNAGARGEAVYISPYAHPDVIAGAGTIGLEILEDDPSAQLIVAAVGGGGLLSGIALAAPETAVAGAEIAASTPFTRSLESGRIVPIEVGNTIADGLVGNLDPETPTFDILRQRVESIVVATEEETRAAVLQAFVEERLVVEGAAAVALAAVRSRRVDTRGRRTVIIVSGANIDPQTLAEALSSKC